jgi:hypothetical protein
LCSSILNADVLFCEQFYDECMHADVEEYLKAQSERKGGEYQGEEADAAKRRVGARVVATGASREVVVATGAAWQHDAGDSKKAAFGQ